MSEPGDLRHNGAFFETLTSIETETISWSDAENPMGLRPLGPDQRREGAALITETWRPYLTERARWRAVTGVDPDHIVQPLTTEFDELVAEGWSPPGDRDLPPPLCLDQRRRDDARVDPLVCHLLKGHGGQHHDQVSGWSWG